MGGIFGGGGGGGVDLHNSYVDTNRAVKATNRAADAANKRLQKAYKLYNPEESQQFYSDAQSRLAGFEPRATLRAAQAYDANYQPIQQEIQKNLSDRFAGLGRAGRSNSRGQFAMSRYGRELADTAGQRLMGIGDEARARYLQEATGVYNPALATMGQITGVLGNQAGVEQQRGQAVADAWNRMAGLSGNAAMQNAQMANQNRNNSKNSVGSVIGGGLGLATSFLSDRRLKENIQAVGKLDNGLTVYSYNYKGTPGIQIGLMADEVVQLHPAAVSTHPSGYKQVNYGEAVV